jgi:hypothetical protein
MSGKSFLDFRLEIAGAKKLEQVLAAFAGCMDPSIPKYICAPCSNCKAQFRDLLAHRGLRKANRIFYGGVAELVVNAMRDANPGFLDWEWRRGIPMQPGALPVRSPAPDLLSRPVYWRS